jgi:group I intron endonuclease
MKIYISGIYKISCLINNKFYIGSSFDIEGRIKKHFKQLEKNKHTNPHLQYAYNLYGKSNFKWDIIEKCDVEKLLEIEQEWMDKTKCYDRNIGFNNCIKSDSPFGYKHTDENKKIMSELKKGKKLNLETVHKISQSNKGKKRTAEQKEKMSKSKLGNKNPMYGKKEDFEHKKNRMKNMLSVPRWNKGLTKEQDPRLEKLATCKGKIPPNALKCELINLKTKDCWYGNSLKELSKNCPISLATINRIKNKTCGKKIKETYILNYEN